MATSVTQDVIEPNKLRRSSSVGKLISPNIGQSKFFDYASGSGRKPTIPNNGQNIQPHRTRASTGSFREMVNIARHSTGKESSPKSGESVSPRYLRASTGSCHDFCKYGRKHEFDVKARRPTPKRAIIVSSERQNPTEFVVSSERKITTVVKVRPKPSPVSKLSSSNEKEISQDENKNNLSEEKGPAKPKTMTFKLSTAPDTAGGLSGRKNSVITIVKKNRTSIADVKEIVATPKASVSPKPSNSVAVILNVNRHRSRKFLSHLKVQNRARKNEPKQPNSEKVLEKTLHVIKVETENEVLECAQNGITIHSPLSPELALLKSSSLPKSLALSSHEETEQEDTNSEVDETDYSVAETNETVNLHKVKASEGNGKKRTPGKGRVGISDNNDSSSAKLKFRRGKVVDLKSENGGPRRLRFRWGRVLGENQDTKSDVGKRNLKKREVESDKDSTLPGLKENHKRAPGKDKVCISEDCEPSKMKFRKGKVVDPQLENSSPMRLSFRRGLALEKNQDSKSDVGKTGFKKRGVEGDANGTEDSSEKVILRHQCVQGKKDAQGLFNNVIEETASKLVESRKSKVKALVGAFETVISLQENKPST